MNRYVAVALLTALTASPIAAQEDEVEQVQRDAWAIERIAEVSQSGRDMPRATIEAMLDESLDILRGASADGAYRWARYQRQEAERQVQRQSLGPTGPDDPAVAQVTGDLAYAIRVDVPSRRLLFARNRRAWIDRIEIDYRELGAFRRAQTFRVERWLEPGEGVEFELDHIARRATARVIGWGDPEERGNSVIEMSWLVPQLVDDPANPHANAVATLHQLRSAVSKRDREETRNLAAQLAGQVAPSASDQGRPRAEAVDSQLPARAQPGLSRDTLLYELRTIEELMRSRDDSFRGSAEQRLRELIRMVEQLPLR